MRFPLTRRSALLTGVTGIALLSLSACGLRIDADPTVPALDATDRLRNRIARILAATTPGSGDPRSAAQDLASLVAAIGPVWAPPTELATEPAPTEPARSFTKAAAEVSAVVLPNLASLRADLAPVLLDVAFGMVLVAGTVDRSLVTGAQTAVEAAVAGASSTGEASSSPAAEVPAGSSADAGDVLSAVLQAARAAEFGYETLTPRFPVKSTTRTAALDRVMTLEALAGDTLSAMATAKADVPRDYPTWTLDPEPTTAEAARTLAARLEDGIAAALLPRLGEDPDSALHLWNSARTRAAFAAPQLLRYTYTDQASADPHSGTRPAATPADSPSTGTPTSAGSDSGETTSAGSSERADS